MLCDHLWPLIVNTDDGQRQSKTNTYTTTSKSSLSLCLNGPVQAWANQNLYQYIMHFLSAYVCACLCTSGSNWLNS